MTTELVPAAQYLRMSTENQQHSVENQRTAIAAYAAANNFKIIATFEDLARTGLSFHARPALKALIQNVVALPEFRAVLVYDVSRWGRFQDLDEAAHYEFICSSSGIPVHYCGEPFKNNSGLSSSLMKSLKRAMAAEYSRELGNKTILGERHLSSLGYKMGGAAPFGLRRLLVGADGRSKTILKLGDRKSLSNDRVRYTWGPVREVTTVRTIFRLFLEGSSPKQIANSLNERRLLYFSDDRWNSARIKAVLHNPVYSGEVIWGRTTSRLHTRVTPTARKDWVIKSDGVKPIISVKSFAKAQERFPGPQWTDEELLAGLKSIWETEGRVRAEILESKKYGPCYATYVRRFGSFEEALRKIGYPIQMNECHYSRGYEIKQLHQKIVCKLAKMFPERLQELANPRGHRHWLLLDRTFHIEVSIARQYMKRSGRSEWLLSSPSNSRRHITLCCFLNLERRVRKMCFVPYLSHRSSMLRIRPDDDWFRSSIRLATLRSFCDVALRSIENSI